MPKSKEVLSSTSGSDSDSEVETKVCFHTNSDSYTWIYCSLLSHSVHIGYMLYKSDRITVFGIDMMRAKNMRSICICFLGKEKEAKHTRETCQETKEWRKFQGWWFVQEQQ